MIECLKRQFIFLIQLSLIVIVLGSQFFEIELLNIITNSELLLLKSGLLMSWIFYYIIVAIQEEGLKYIWYNRVWIFFAVLLFALIEFNLYIIYWHNNLLARVLAFFAHFWMIGLYLLWIVDNKLKSFIIWVALHAAFNIIAMYVWWVYVIYNILIIMFWLITFILTTERIIYNKI